ncbi:MAG: hypothetical protein KY453_09765 [Gemmatimonadetes bacterium]|nr:hypothetical protein [Gemmatimonadota bacterium]
MADPAAQQVWTRMMETLAPGDGWARTRYLAFDFVVDRGEDGRLVRSHRWDVWSGDYRVEAPVGEEGTLVALFDVDEPTAGRAWLDGTPVEGARADSLLERAHAMFINDSYWLLMPYKWADEGVHARYLGEMEEWGETWEVVELTFDSVGLTPRNRYRAFVDPETGRMELWQHFRDTDDEEPAFTTAWTGWQRYGPISLASGRPDQEGVDRLTFENLEASESVPDNAFAPPTSGDP